MKHPFRKVVALVLCVLLTAALLPAASATQVTEAQLRSAVVAQAQSIATVPWTTDSRVAKADVIDDRLAAFHAGGILPTTYFEYKRLHFPIRGVMVESNPGTLEQFTAQFYPTVTKVEGFSHMTPQARYVGMDANSFLADVVGRVSPVQFTSLKQALTDPALEALLPGLNLSAASSAGALGSVGLSGASQAYAKLGAGDLLLAWDDNSKTGEGGQPRIHTMVVQSVDAANDKVTVIYPTYALLKWHLVCDKCGTTDVVGPTSAALPDHVNSVSYSFGSFKKHSDTYPTATCGGTWTPIHATSWVTETVSFADLFGAGVPYGSVGYLPYTLDVYSKPIAPEATLTTDVTPEMLAAGFEGTITSNCRVSIIEAVLTSGSSTQTFWLAPTMNGNTAEYNDPALTLALMQCDAGDYNLTINLHFGPTNQDANPFQPIKVYSQDFTLAPSSFRLVSDTEKAQQGETFTLSLKAHEAGYTGVNAFISCDPSLYSFDAAASMAISPNATFTQQADGTINAQYYGPAVEAGGTVLKLVLSPIRNGGWGKTKDLPPFNVARIFASTKEGARAADLIASRADSDLLFVGVGMNTQVYKNYAAGQDLVLVYLMTDDMRGLNSNSKMPMAYDGQPMYDVTTAHYSINNNSWLRIYAYITENADASKVAKETETCPVLTYSYDVNESGAVDIADVQTISNIASGRLPLDGNFTKWLLADIDRNGVVDSADQYALMSILRK